MQQNSSQLQISTEIRPHTEQLRHSYNADQSFNQVKNIDISQKQSSSIFTNPHQSKVIHNNNNQNPYVKPLKPRLFNFVAKEPHYFEEFSHVMESTKYQSFQIHAGIRINNHSFQPRLQNKKLYQEPKFYLSIQRKKLKTANASTQRASTYRPSRNSYRGSKVRSVGATTVINQQQAQKYMKNKRIQPFQMNLPQPPKRKQPNMHFNLQNILKKRKTFDQSFKVDQNIQGSNFAYYKYFTSVRSPIPMSSRTSNSSESPSRAHTSRQQKHQKITPVAKSIIL